MSTKSFHHPKELLIIFKDANVRLLLIVVDRWSLKRNPEKNGIGKVYTNTFVPIQVHFKYKYGIKWKLFWFRFKERHACDWNQLNVSAMSYAILMCLIIFNI